MTRVQYPLEFTSSPTLELRADAVRIDIQPVEPGGTPRIEVDATHDTSSELLDVHREGDVVSVRVGGTHWGKWIFSEEGVKRLRVYVPQHVRARIASGMGQMRIERLAGCDLELAASAGSIKLEQVRGRIVASVDSGSIHGEHLAGTFDVQSHAGSVKLGIDSLDGGLHRVRTSMGSVRVELASGIDVRVETATSLGSARNKYPSNQGSKTVLRLEAELGSVKVVEGGAHEDDQHGDWPDWRRMWADVVSTARDAVTQVAHELDAAMPHPPQAASASAAAAKKVGDAELKQVLELVQAGKLSAVDAERLIRAMGA